MDYNVKTVLDIGIYIVLNGVGYTLDVGVFFHRSLGIFCNFVYSYSMEAKEENLLEDIIYASDFLTYTFPFYREYQQTDFVSDWIDFKIVDVIKKEVLFKGRF